jgi:AcrR family transcriptional regulator
MLNTSTPAERPEPEGGANPVGPHTPRRMKRAAEILAAARETFLEKGFARASVAEIAAKVGVVEGLLYTYYPTKRDLLNDVLRAMYEPLIRDIEDGFSRIHGVRSRLRFLIWRHLRVYVEEPNLSRLVLHEVRTGPEYFASVLHDLHVRYTGFLVHTIRDAIADGEVRADTDVELVRSMVYGGIEHRMWGTLFGRGAVDIERTADDCTRMVLGDLLFDGGAGARAAAPSDPLQLLADVRERLDRLEHAVRAPRAAAKAAQRTRRKDESL